MPLHEVWVIAGKTQKEKNIFGEILSDGMA